MKPTRLVVWGGSSLAVPEFVDVLRKSLLPDEALQVVLVGRSADKLRLVGELCRKLAQAAQADLQVTYTTDMPAALQGADYILSQVRPGGLQGRAFDESFPRKGQDISPRRPPGKSRIQREHGLHGRLFHG